MIKKYPGQRIFYGRLNRGHRQLFGDRFAGFMHAHKDGSPVLRGDSSWRTVNGIYVNHPRGFFTVQFRRFE